MRNIRLHYWNIAPTWLSLSLISMTLALVAIVLALIRPAAIEAYAVTESGNRAYLYFYTLDGEEIEELEKKVGKKKTYLFPDPDQYKYLPIEEGEEEVYPELYYQVTGICWEERDEDGRTVGEYKKGEMFHWSAGDHYFYAKSDNPVLTGENLLDVGYQDQAHLYFHNVNGEEIYSLSVDLSTKDEFTFPNPERYAYWFEAGENLGDGESITSSEYTGKGIYWYCRDDNDKEYLFADGNTCRFKPGEYFFYAKTDDPVEITFYYPLDVDTYYVTDDCPGDVYAVTEAVVGETIQLKRSLGAVLWKSTFRGWEEVNRGEDRVYSGESSYRVMENTPLDFFAVYEGDENWNPDAVDENRGKEEQELEKEPDLMVDVDQINEAAGAGYQAYVDENGKLKRTGGGVKVNRSLSICGIPGIIQTKKSLSPLKNHVDGNDPEDYRNPENYKFDKYGRKMEESNLEPEINNVLRQDHSAMYMDVYGNAFVYYSQLSRKDNMLLAYDRLSLGKTDSWVKNISGWDTEMVRRFEAIEFALLKGTYPGDGEELAPGVFWKKEYLSKKAFDQLKPYKKAWNGWLDRYDDGLLERYKGQNQGGGITVGRLKSHNLFGITAYAAETGQSKNSLGQAKRSSAQVLNSLDLEGYQLKPQYYNPNTLYNFSLYSFSSLSSELSAEQIQVLKQIFNALVEYGFTEEAAAGACGNIWQECTFNPSIAGGIVQWMGNRQKGLISYAGDRDWRELSVQIGFMKKELDSGYLQSMNKVMGRLSGGAAMINVRNVQAACDAWCVAMEGCACQDGSGKLYPGHAKVHNSACAQTLGKSYQHLAKRREYAQKVYNAMVLQGDFIGGNFAGMAPDEILHQLFPKLKGSYKMLGTYYSEAEMNAMMATVRVAGTNKTIRVHACIADGVKAAFEELAAQGFRVEQVGGFTYRGIARNGGYLSVKTNASFHASGLAVDVNWSWSPQFSGTPGIEVIRKTYKPQTEPRAVNRMVYHAFKSQGLLWGRDFGSWYDLMHFSLGEVSQDGRNAWITNGTEGSR